MGFIKGGALVFVSVILFIVVLLGSIFSVLSLSLEYKNVQKEIGYVAKNLVEEKSSLIKENFNLTTEMEKAEDFMREHCLNETSYVFASGGYTFVLPCSLLEKDNESADVFIDSGVSSIVYDIYYDDYGCNFWNCFKKAGPPLFLVSEKAKNYWQEKFYFSLIVFLILAALVFLLVEQKQNTPIIIGSIFMVSSVVLLKVGKLPELLIGKSYSQFVNVFLSKTSTVFWILLVFGLVLVVAGISFRLLGINIMKKKFSREEVKEIVKAEVSKEKLSDERQNVVRRRGQFKEEVDNKTEGKKKQMKN